MADATGRVRVTGLDKLAKRLGEIPGEALEAARLANQQNADEFVDQVKAIVPVGETGRLRDSIRKEDEGAIGVRVTIGGGEAYYATFVEYGHMDGKTHVPARPFWWTTWRLNKPRFKRRTRRALLAAIRKVQARGGS